MNNTNCINGSSTNGVFTCNACANGNYMGNDNNCYPLPTTATNCINGTFSGSTFTCNSCNDGYYLNSTA